MAMLIRETMEQYKAHVSEAEKKGSKRAVTEGVNTFGKKLRKMLREGKDAAAQYPSIQESFIEAYGYEEFKHCKATNEIDIKRLTEASGAVSTASLMNIQNQFAYSTVMDAYEDPEFVLTRLIPERQGNVPGTERIPGIQRMGNETGVVGEGKDYPIVGPGEDYIEYTEPDKAGEIVPVTKEAVFYDRTGLLVSRCQEVGRSYGIRLEIAAADCIIDENVTNHRYRWKGTAIATYNNNTGTHTWDNLEASNALADWPTLNKAYLLLRQMVDPYTGLPCMFQPKTLIVDSTLEIQALLTIGATMNEQKVGGYATSGNLNSQMGANPFARFGINVVATPYIGYRMTTDTNWFVGDPTKAFARNVHFPMEVTQAPAGSEDDFKRDIVMQFKVSGKQKFETPQPRAMVKNTA